MLFTKGINLTIEHRNHRNQLKNVNALRALAETCEFQTLKDNLIHDRIVCGVRDNVVRRKLLQESSLTLTKCVDICRAAEAATAQIKEMAPSQQPTEVDFVSKSKRENFKKSKAIKGKEKFLKNPRVDECKFCGRQHERKREKCPAYGQTCSSCGKSNHFAVKCGIKSHDSKRSSYRFKNKPKIHQIAENSDQSYLSEEDILFVENSECKSKIFAHMEIECMWSGKS